MGDFQIRHWNKQNQNTTLSYNRTPPPTSHRKQDGDLGTCVKTMSKLIAESITAQSLIKPRCKNTHTHTSALTHCTHQPTAAPSSGVPGGPRPALGRRSRRRGPRRRRRVQRSIAPRAAGGGPGSARPGGRAGASPSTPSTPPSPSAESAFPSLSSFHPPPKTPKHSRKATAWVNS